MNYKSKAKELVSQMTLEEKASLCSGKDFWNLKGIERLGLKPVMVTDGPHGLRKQAASSDHLGLNDSVPATCFPAASATACSFDRDLLKEMGKAMGEECIAEEVATILGPGANIKRSPLCGRNFEYFSEDPYLTGEMAAALIEGIQSKNVGTSLKHFAVNNQEASRMTVDSVVDERAFREIYLTGFEIAVKKAKPWTVMCSYNKINGTYASDNSYLLTDILRKEWGFDGLVVSDWGAVNDRVEGVKAGMDLEMPATGTDNDEAVVAAVKNGLLKEELLDQNAIRVTELILRTQDNKPVPYRPEDHDELARKVAENSAVLLKNENDILPLTKKQKIAVIGTMAKDPRYQGSGSSKIHPTSLDNAFEALKTAGADIQYAPGYPSDSRQVDQGLIDEACRLAASSDVAVIFSGLPDEYESEGFDRTSLDIPDSHNQLIHAVVKANKNTIVVLQCGSPIIMPWKDEVKGILLMYLAGQAGGRATANLLLGEVNPSGKLPESYPYTLEDNPSAMYFPGNPKSVQYRESIFVGYRYYDTAKKEVVYPFGYGLSYTTFEYSNMKLEELGPMSWKVSIDVKNTGSMAGAEIVQLYIHCKKSAILRAEKELKGFQKLFLEPGEQKTAEFILEHRSFAYYNPKASDWCVEGGNYEIMAAASSADIRLSQEIMIEGDGKEQLLVEDYKELPQYRTLSKPFRVDTSQFEKLLGHNIPTYPNGRPYTASSPMEDIKDTFIGKIMVKQLQKGMQDLAGQDGFDPSMLRMMQAMLMEAPIRSLKMFSQGAFNNNKVEGVVAMANRKFFKGIRYMLKK